jgi:hypothetical protein
MHSRQRLRFWQGNLREVAPFAATQQLQADLDAAALPPRLKLRVQCAMPTLPAPAVAAPVPPCGRTGTTANAAPPATLDPWLLLDGAGDGDDAVEEAKPPCWMQGVVRQRRQEAPLD